MDEHTINNELSQTISKYNKQCDLLNMISIPTFGIYSKDYSFLEQILILKKDSIPSNIPIKMEEQIIYLENKYQDLKIEFYNITLSTSILFSISPESYSSSYTALNFISHPYIFYNCKLEKEHKSDIYCAAYTNEELEINYIKEAEGNTHLRLNPKCYIDDESLKREVYLHLSDDGYPSLSPNNCHLLINLNEQIINFYVITCGTYFGKIVKCFVGNYIIIPNINNSILFNKLYENMNKETIKQNLIVDLFLFRNRYNDFIKYILYFFINEIIKNSKNIESIKNYLIKAFTIIFDLNISKNDEYAKIMNNISNNYYNNIIDFIDYLYPNSKNISNDFGEKILENSLKNNYIQDLLIKYIKYHTNKINNIILNIIDFISTNENILFELQNKSNEKYEKEIFQNIKYYFCGKLKINTNEFENMKHSLMEENRKENPNIEILLNICECIKNKEDISVHLNKLDDIIKYYLFYIVWEYKGKICGVHKDFGRISFMRINEIDQKYFCNDEERINCCQELIQYLINAEEKI